MEFVRGVTLGAYLKARGPMPLAEFVPFFECIAEVVHAAHERGINPQWTRGPLGGR